jgi:hypothetical protein
MEVLMKMFIWEYVSELTVSYHDGGGVVVVASTLERARELLPPNCSAVKEDPGAVYVLAGPVEERVYAFPDAGCC